jgi:hypothetical protein
MHHTLTVHLLQSSRQTHCQFLNLRQTEGPLTRIDPGLQRASFQQFQNNINRVFGLEDSLELDDVGMIEFAQCLQLIYKFSSVCNILGQHRFIFGKGLHSESLPVRHSLHFVDRR